MVKRKAKPAAMSNYFENSGVFCENSYFISKKQLGISKLTTHPKG